MPSWPTILEFHSCPFHLGVSSCKNVVEISLQQIFKRAFCYHDSIYFVQCKKIICGFLCLNLVGGIYTVIRSKAPAAVDVLGNKYCLIGIYNDLQCKTEVEMVEPEDPAIKGAIQAMRDSGVEV